jgi:hypothetical protein
MKALLCLTLTAAAFADPDARMASRRAKADFEPTADPASPYWKSVEPIAGAVDPFGQPATSNRFTFRTQWTENNLYFLFECPYDELNLKQNPTQSEETNKLWEWDVVEVFIGADFDNIHRYRELQVSPQGEWVDLDIDRNAPKPEGGWRWNSGMKTKARIDRANRTWYGEMKVPMSSINAQRAAPGSEFRINVYRLAGTAPKRIQVMWTPTRVRSHHTPEKFGRIVLR